MKRGHLNSHYGNPLKDIGDKKQVSIEQFNLLNKNTNPFILLKKHFKAQEEI